MIDSRYSLEMYLEIRFLFSGGGCFQETTVTEIRNSA